MEAAFKVLTELVQRTEHKMDSFNVRMKKVEKSLEELRLNYSVSALGMVMGHIWFGSTLLQIQIHGKN